jgi:hypothetical protein
MWGRSNWQASYWFGPGQEETRPNGGQSPGIGFPQIERVHKKEIDANDDEEVMLVTQCFLAMIGGGG